MISNTVSPLLSLWLIPVAAGHLDAVAGAEALEGVAVEIGEATGHLVVAGADFIGVAAQPAVEGVVAGAAVEDIGPAGAGDLVIERVTGAIDAVDAVVGGQLQHLDMGAQGMADRGLHRVSAAVEAVGRDIAGVVDDEQIVALAAAERVGAGGAVQRVVAGVAGQAVVTAIAGAGDIVGAAQFEMFEIVAEGVVTWTARCRCHRRPSAHRRRCR